jgi:amidase
MWNDGVVKPHPPITRALREFASRLETIPNIQIVDWKGHLHDEAWAIISSLYFTDGGAEDAATIASSGEPWRPLTTFIIKENPCVKKLTPQKLYYWQEEREAYRKEYAKVWNDTATGRSEDGELEGMVDAILCPVGPGVAPLHGTSKYWGYTSLWNLLDYPAVSFPVAKVEKEKDGAEEGFSPLTELDEENFKLCELPFKKPVASTNSIQITQRLLMNCRSPFNLLEEDLRMKRFWPYWSILQNELVFPFAHSLDYISFT